MAYKVFLAPTGSGNVIFEGDVLNGYTTPDGKDVVLKFYSNDRGYTCGAFGQTKGSIGPGMDFSGAKALRDELAHLLESNSANPLKFHVVSANKHFTLAREQEGAPMILGCIGTDKRFGSSFHRGSADDLKKVLAEFDTVLKTIEDAMAGKGPAA